MINQAIRFHVEQNQLGWVHSLPKVRFDIMNLVNSSTGLSMFELRYGCSPRILPLLSRNTLTKSNASKDVKDTCALLEQIACLEREAKDNLTATKVLQAYHADKVRGPCEIFEVGDWVMLSTLHCCDAYKKAGE